MRNLSITVLSVCCMLCSLCSFAQGAQNKTVPINEPDNNKPKLFADLPERVDFNPNNLSNLFELQVGQSVNIPLTAGINFTGQVVSTSTDPKAASIVIRLTNRIGARLTFTKITDENNDVKYIGRIISQKHGDSYEIVFENNQYYFKKKGFYDLMTE
jgi:hypothetical protein